MTFRAATSALVLAFAAGCSGACSADESGERPKPGDAGKDSAAGGSGGASGGAGGTKLDGGDASPPCVPPPKPDIVPEGWEAYTDFSCAQPFYIPSSEQYLPEPVQWEDCAPPAGLATGCRQMKITWPGSTAASWSRLSPTADGHWLLFFGRVAEEPFDGHVVGVVADVEGSTRFGILGPRLASAGYAMVAEDLNEGRIVLKALGGDGATGSAFESKRKGVLVGTVGKLKPVLHHLELTSNVYSYRISSKFLVRAEAPAQRLLVFPTNGSPEFEMASATSDLEGLVPDLPILLGDVAVFTVESLHSQGIMAYDPVQKTHPLIRWYGDTTKGAYNVGTDGKDLVWTFGEDHPPTGGSYEKRSVWTSPFSTDPKKLTPKRLRSDPETAFDVNFSVGCGYAAHKLQPADGMLVVRLSDGVSWILPNELPAPAKTGWVWLQTIGVTCDEVFATAAVVGSPGAKSVYTIARVRLDALGPGLAPD